MTATQVRLGINPLPWIFSPDAWEVSETTIRAALEDLRSVGFHALHAEVPEGMSSAQYTALLADYDFVPAPGYFQSAFEDVDDRSAMLERARAAAAQQAELGLDTVFIAGAVHPTRLARPAVGTDADDERLKVIGEGLTAAADVMAAEGVRPGLHPHVGSWIEVEPEVRGVLDATAGSALWFGPDTGHLAWAGADPAAVMRDYRDRIVATHLKDVDAAAARRARDDGADYGAATFGQHVWAEPGRGSIDFDAVFAALPDDFAGWAVIEVDVPNLPTRVESAQASLEWARGRPELAT